MRVFQNKVNLWWTRQLLIDVILSKPAALMLLFCQKPCNHVGSLRLLFCIQTASETTTHRHVRSCFAGFLRKDLGRHGSHHRSLRIRIIRHVAVFELYRFVRQFFGCAATVLQFGGHIYCEWPASWSSVELRDCRAQQKSCGQELFMTACDSCCFCERGFALIRHSAVERRRVNIHHVPKVLCVCLRDCWKDRRGR